MRYYRIIFALLILFSTLIIACKFWRKGVIPTFLIDLPVLMLFGVLFAIFTKSEGGNLMVFKSPYFWHGVLFSTIFNVAVVYAIVYYPDWMWMYFLEQSRNSLVELVYLFIFLYYLPYVLGFYLGRMALIKGLKWWLGALLFFAGWEVWLVAHLFDRYSVIGSRNDFFEGKALSLFGPENPIGPVMNSSLGVLAVYFIVLVIFYKKRKGPLAETEL